MKDLDISQEWPNEVYSDYASAAEIDGVRQNYNFPDNQTTESYFTNTMDPILGLIIQPYTHLVAEIPLKKEQEWLSPDYSEEKTEERKKLEALYYACQNQGFFDLSFEQKLKLKGNPEKAHALYEQIYLSQQCVTAEDRKKYNTFLANQQRGIQEGQKVFNILADLNPELEILRPHIKKPYRLLDILRGIASGYKPEDIQLYIDLRPYEDRKSEEPEYQEEVAYNRRHEQVSALLNQHGYDVNWCASYQTLDFLEKNLENAPLPNPKSEP